MDKRRYTVTYRHGQDYCKVWVYAHTAEEAKDIVRHEYWDIDEIISIN